MKNKYLLSLLAALGFSGCSNNEDILDMPLYYGPGPVWPVEDEIIITQVQNEDGETINGIRVVASYKNQKDSLITDTIYTKSLEVDGLIAGGIAVNTLKFEKYPPKGGDLTLEYTDVDGEENGAYQKKTIMPHELEKGRKVTLLKEKKEEEE